MQIQAISASRRQKPAFSAGTGPASLLFAALILALASGPATAQASARQDGSAPAARQDDSAPSGIFTDQVSVRVINVDVMVTDSTVSRCRSRTSTPRPVRPPDDPQGDRRSSDVETRPSERWKRSAQAARGGIMW